MEVDVYLSLRARVSKSSPDEDPDRGLLIWRNSRRRSVHPRGEGESSAADAAGEIWGFPENAEGRAGQAEGEINGCRQGDGCEICERRPSAVVSHRSLTASTCCSPQASIAVVARELAGRLHHLATMPCRRNGCRMDALHKSAATRSGRPGIGWSARCACADEPGWPVAWPHEGGRCSQARGGAWRAQTLPAALLRSQASARCMRPLGAAGRRREAVQARVRLRVPRRRSRWPCCRAPAREASRSIAVRMMATAICDLRGRESVASDPFPSSPALVWPPSAVRRACVRACVPLSCERCDPVRPKLQDRAPAFPGPITAVEHAVRSIEGSRPALHGSRAQRSHVYVTRSRRSASEAEVVMPDCPHAHLLDVACGLMLLTCGKRQIPAKLNPTIGRLADGRVVRGRARAKASSVPYPS